MWQRLLRLLATGLNAYSFYSNPFRFILALLTVVLIPYLTYIFWGTVVFTILVILVIYLLYRVIQSRKQSYY